MQRLLRIADLRLPFAEAVERLRRQRQWLIDLEHLLDPAQSPDQVPLTAQSVAKAVEHYLTTLTAQVTADSHPDDQAVVAQIEQTLRHRWWGLFTCYDVEGLPRTNNDLETFLRRIKTGQRRVGGRKNVHDFIIRYGRYVAYIDHQESLDDLLARLRQVSHDDFLRERQDLDTALLREQKRFRSRHRRAIYLRELEGRWTKAVELAGS